MRKRLRKVFLCAAAAAVAGYLYGGFVERTGIAVPCLFRLLTGWKCPGCGVTRMCIAWMHLDIRAAFEGNQMLCVLTPVLAIVFLNYVVFYVRTGQWRMGRLSTGVVYGSAALLLLFAVYRNLAGI